MRHCHIVVISLSLTHTHTHPSLPLLLSLFSLEKVREELAVRLYPKRVILIRHAEVSKTLTYINPLSPSPAISLLLVNIPVMD